MTGYGKHAGAMVDERSMTSRERPATDQFIQEGKMDFLLTLTLIVLMIVVPVVAGMAMGYGLDSDDER